MYSSDASSAVRTFADHPHVRPPRRPYPRVSRRQLLTSLILSLWLLADMLGGWIFLIPQAYAAKGPSDPPAKVTFHTFLNDKRPTHVYHGPLVFPRTGPTVPHDTNAQGHGVDMAHLLHSNGSATMQPISQLLDASLMVGAPTGGAPLDLKGSDGHLEVLIEPGSLDFAHTTPGQSSSTSHPATATPTVTTTPTATTTPTVTTPSATPGLAPSGPFTLHVSQLKGHFAAEMNLLGTYQLQVTDAQGNPVSGIRLTSPLTIIYHYQPGELEALDLDPSGVLLSWTGLLSAARAAGQPTTGLVIPLAYDPKAQTLSGQSTVLGAGPLVIGGPTANQSPPIPILASVLGNSGQLGLSYPITLPPNARGFLPSLSLSYTSAGTNQRTTPTSPADMVGDGWSLGLGSITAAEYPSGSAGSGTWYFLSGAGNVSDRLVPASQSGFYQTLHISHLRIHQVTSSDTGQLCFQVYDTSGTSTSSSRLTRAPAPSASTSTSPISRTARPAPPTPPSAPRPSSRSSTASTCPTRPRKPSRAPSTSPITPLTTMHRGSPNTPAITTVSRRPLTDRALTTAVTTRSIRAAPSARW